MSKYTKSHNESTQPPKDPRTRIRSSSIPRPMRPLERPAPCTNTVNKSEAKSLKDNTVSERYTNSSYNRIRSPKGRIQTPTLIKESLPYVTEEQQRKRASERVKPPKPSPRLVTMNQSCSNTNSKRRPLDAECNKADTLKPRPKTSHCSRTESQMEHRVLGTVKSVLSQALVQQGKIDETNIENIISDMRSRLNLYDEEFTEIDIEQKPSRTTLKELNLSRENSSVKNNKSVAGIMRKDKPDVAPERRHYRKIYDESDSPSKQSMNLDGSQGDDNNMGCVDLPDNTFFPLSENDEKNRVKQSVEYIAKQIQQSDTSERDGLSRQFEIGDFQTNHFWNSSEEAKLQEYVESLINNIKNQMNSEKPVAEIEGEIDSQGSLCRTICVCKVCVSKKSESKSVMKKPKPEEPIVIAKESQPLKSLIHKPKPSKTGEISIVPEESKPLKSSVQKQRKGDGSKPPILHGVRVRPEFVKASLKEGQANSPFTVIKNTNLNFKPESSLNTSLNNHCPSYAVVNNVEDGDDKYLRVRINRRTSGKPK